MRKSGPEFPPPGVAVDSRWYLSQYPDVKREIKSGRVQSALDHFLAFGYREGRVPSKPNVDEAWYLATYPDVAEAVRNGSVKSAYDHFIKNGYGEGRKPNNKS